MNSARKSGITLHTQNSLFCICFPLLSDCKRERVDTSAAEFFVKVNHVPKVILDFFETSTAAAEDKSVRFSLQELEPKDEKEVNATQRKKGPSLR